MAISDQKLKNIIKAYKTLRNTKPDVWISFTTEQRNIRDAIRVAALCINKDNKRHSHQYRLKQETLNATNEELQQISRKVRGVKTFDELYQLIMSLDVYGLGRLTRYDIATRIGAYLNLYPDRVYLHAGTKAGAIKLLGKVNKDYLFKSDLPKPFRIKSLEYHEIEDILCVFKDRFDLVDPEQLLRSRMC